MLLLVLVGQVCALHVCGLGIAAESVAEATFIGEGPGSLDPGFHTPWSSGSEYVHALALQSDGKILLAGGFGWDPSWPNSRLVRLFPDGTPDIDFKPVLVEVTTAGPFLKAITVQPDGRIVIGGWFASVNGVSRTNLARLNVDGTTDLSFQPSPGCDNIVDDLALLPDGRIYVVGLFTNVNGAFMPGIARLLADGQLDTSFQPGVTEAVTGVESVAVQPDGNVLIAGRFEFRIGDRLWRRLARLKPDGSIDSGFQPPDLLCCPLSLALQPDGRILVGGNFPAGPEAPIANLLRLLPNGSVDTTFKPDIPPGAATLAILTEPGGKIVVGSLGDSCVGLSERQGLRRLNNDGRLDGKFHIGTFEPQCAPVTSLLRQPDGMILAAGAFTGVAGLQRSSVVRVQGGDEVPLEVRPRSQSLWVGNQSSLSVRVAGAGPWTFQWRKNGIPLGGETNGTLFIMGARLADAGDYTVRATGPDGMWTEASARIAMSDRPSTSVPVAWGWNSDLQTEPPPGLTNLVALSMGGWHVLALNSSGRVISWGRNAEGQSTIPGGLIDVAAVAAGGWHSLALKRDGTVVSWGAERLDVDVGQADVPAGLGDVVAVAAGFQHSLALKRDGTVVGWGARTSDTDAGQVTPPVGLRDVVAIAAGAYHSLALRSDGRVVGWGGRKEFTDRGQITPPAALSNVVGITAGWWHSAALVSDGRVVVWGAMTAAPPDADNVVAIAGGFDHMLALRADGAVVGWGAGSKGWRWPFNAHASQATVPLGLRGVTDLAAGGTSSAILMSGPPAIIQRPHDQVMSEGGIAQFSVMAGGPGPMNYEWTLNDVAIPGANSPQLMVSNARRADLGRYQVRISNSLGATTGPSANLSFNDGAPGAVDRSFRPVVSAAAEMDEVRALALQSDGKICLAGYLVNQGHDGVARLNADGTLDSTFSAGEGAFDGRVLALGVDAQGRILLGGSYASFQGIWKRLLRLHADGSVDSGFLDALDGPDGYVLAILPLANGQILVGGGFGHVNGRAQSCVARLSSDGQLDMGFKSPEFASGGDGVRAMAVQSDGKLLVAGTIAINHPLLGYLRSLVRLNTDGTIDASFHFPWTEVANSGLWSVAIQSDGRILMGGDIEGASRIVRLHSDGRLDGSFLADGVPDGSVRSIAIQPDGRILVAFVRGSGLGWDENPESGVMRLLPDGRRDETFQSPSVLPFTLQSDRRELVALQSDGQILMAGDFASVGGMGLRTRGIVRLGNAIAPRIVRNPVGQLSVLGATVRLYAEASGTPPLLYQWQVGDRVLPGATNEVLTLFGVKLEDSGEYVVRVRNGAGEVTSEPARIAILITPKIEEYPRDQVAVPGGGASFSVRASGSPPLRIQWQRNGVNLAGATNVILQLTNLTWALAGEYRAVVRNDIGFATSASGRLVVLAPPVIRVQPVGGTASVGETVRLVVTADGSLPLTYQWFANGHPLPDAQKPELDLGAVVPAQAGNYWVTVSNLAGQATSAMAVVRVTSAPQIVAHPAEQRAEVGATVRLEVGVSGTEPIEVQWQKNGVNLAGATNRVLELKGLTFADGGAYVASVANAAGAISSLPALVRIEAPALVLADDFASRLLMKSSAGVGEGDNQAGTRELGEPLHAGKVGGRSGWISWHAPADGIATFQTSGSSFDTLLAVYTGSQLDELRRIASDDDGGGTLTSSVRFSVEAGREYAVAIDGFDGASGVVLLSWSFEPTLERMPLILRQPRSSSVPAGSRVELSVEASFATSYEWYRNDVLLAGERTASLILEAMAPDQVGLYRVRVYNETRFVDSPSALLEMGQEPQLHTRDKFGDLFAEEERASPARRMTWQKSGFASVSAGVPGSQLLSNFGATKELGEPNHGRVVGGASRWFRLRSPENGLLTVDTIGSDIDTVLAVYTGTNLQSLFLVAADNNGAPDGRRSMVSFAALAGIDYLVAVDGVGGEQGHVILNWELLVLPRVLQSPASVTAQPGDSVSFAVVATGSPPPRYQWRFNGFNLRGATNAILTLANVEFGNEGRYNVEVANVSGSVLSAEAMLRVVEKAPVIVHWSWTQSGHLLLRTTGLEGVVYWIEQSTDLKEWIRLGTCRIQSGSADFIDPNPPVRAGSFYRMRDGE